MENDSRKVLEHEGDCVLGTIVFSHVTLEAMITPRTRLVSTVTWWVCWRGGVARACRRRIAASIDRAVFCCH